MTESHSLGPTVEPVETTVWDTKTAEVRPVGKAQKEKGTSQCVTFLAAEDVIVGFRKRRSSGGSEGLAQASSTEYDPS